MIKRISLPLIALALGLALVAASLFPAHGRGEYDVASFARMPVLLNGRIKPFDTVARSTLLQLQGRQRVTLPNGESEAPIEWLLDLMAKPALADTYQTFEINHPDLLALLQLSTADGAGGKRFSFRQFRAGLKELDRQCQLADGVDASARSSFQDAVLRLRDAIIAYQQLQMALVSPDSADFLRDLQGIASDATLRLATMDRAVAMADSTNLLTIPAAAGPVAEGWRTTGAALIDSLKSDRLDPVALDYVAIAGAWAQLQPETFNRLVRAHLASLSPRFDVDLRRTGIEVRFNAAEPFYTSMVLYVAAGLLAGLSWLKWPDALGRSAYRLIALAFVVSTLGLAVRMWLEGRPPVTNLYSSALFVGWMAVALCLVLETFYRNAIASVAGAAIGFCALLIAHHLALSGDTMEMMRAVLDSNFWLATHVVTVTVGYSAAFLAGFLALIYVLRGTFTRSLDKATADALARMVYGIVCFATIFSFVGTVLGGIWADQSWGRFWGWDPKENGALIIVLWNALILHARWGGLVRQRGFMGLAIFGNVLTAWSWFGVNMLGVGLHSYGFMGAAFWWLAAFVISQIAAIGLIALPRTLWRSAPKPDLGLHA